MKIVAQLFVVIFLAYHSSHVKAQSEVCSCQADSVQLFSFDQKDYHFSFTQLSQGLCFDDIMYETLPEFQVRIFNNTLDTIVNDYRERDAHIYWLRAGGRFDTLYPGQAMTLRGLSPGGQFIGSMNGSTIYLKFRINDRVFTNKIRICGSMYPMDFFSRSFTDVPIYDTTRSSSNEQKVVEADIVTFSENLTFKLKNTKQEPFYDGLKLHYRINSGEQHTLIHNNAEKDQFKIPCILNDTVYYSLFCANYGFLKKGSFIRGKWNEYADCELSDVFSFDQDYWFFMHASNNKAPLGLSSTGMYHIFREDITELFPDYLYFFQLLDSLGITRRDDDYGRCLILNLGLNDPTEVSKRLRNIEMHQTIHPTNHFYDKCYLFFSPKWIKTEADVRAFLKENNIPLASNYPITQVERSHYIYREALGYYWVQIQLPYAFNHANKAFLNELLAKFEIAFIDSGMMLEVRND